MPEMSQSFESRLDPIFGDFENFDVATPSPCRRIEITEQVRALDIAKRAAQTAPLTWTAKASLSIANLQPDRRTVKPGQRLDEQRFEGRVNPSRKRAARVPCKMGCCRQILLTSPSGICRTCRRGKMKSPCKLGCGRKATSKSTLGICWQCWRAYEGLAVKLDRQFRKAERLRTNVYQLRKIMKQQKCSGCEEVIKPGGKTGLCLKCFGASRRAA